MNLPPQPLEADLEGRFTRGIAAIQREVGFAGYLNYREAAGAEVEREAAAAWLSHRVSHARAERIVICPGTQNALLNLLMTYTSPGDVVLTEALTYPGMKAAAALTGVRLVGVEMDGQGVRPDALAIACHQHRPKAVYLTPTIHNPTTATMGLPRRREVARVISDAGVLLFEDDAYGTLAPEMTPLAALLPDQTCLASTLSKCIAPGLRISFLLLPDRSAAARLAQALRATVQMPSPLLVALVTRWLQDGSAAAIIGAIRDEARARQSLAARVLKGHRFAAHPNGHHIWVPLPASWSRAEFAVQVQRHGVAVVTSDAFSADAAPAPHAIRVALGGAATRADLVRALEVLADALRSSLIAARVI